jgi:prefoldin subunit 5
MPKNHEIRRAKLIRQIAEIHQQLDDLTRTQASVEERDRKRQELLQTLADLKKQLLH